MRKTHGFFAFSCRGLAVGLILVVMLAGCGGSGDTGTQLTLNERLRRYERSLREDADTLWTDMNYARSHAYPDPELCPAPTVDHQPVEVDDATRADDDIAGRLADNLKYSHQLIDEARGAWERFCANEQRGADAAAFMQSRLQPAYTTLNTASNTLILRGAPVPSGD